MLNFYRLFAFITLCCLVISCGGGGDSGSTTPTTPAPKPNVAPQANADNATIWVNDLATVAVLSNDTDSDGDSLSIINVSTPANGNAVISGNNVTYTPNQNFIGSDDFSYTISDGKGGTASAALTIVNNKAPNAVNDSVTTTQSTPVTLDLLSNDSSQAELDLTIVSMTTPKYGQLSTQQGLVSYFPQQGYVGQDSFGYVVRDSLGDESTATVSIVIENQHPIANADNVKTLQNKNISISAIDNDVDAQGDTLTISGNTLPQFGNVVIENNTLNYTPELGFSGQDTFTYTLVDNYGATSEAMVIIDVINQQPVVNDDSFNVLSGYPVIVDVLVNDIDAEGDSLTIQSLSSPEQGSAEVIDNKISFTPPTDFEGTILVGYTVKDNYKGKDSGFVTFVVSNGIIVNGVIAGLALENIDVILTAGEYSTTVKTTSTGEFSARVAINSLSALVEVKER